MKRKRKRNKHSVVLIVMLIAAMVIFFNKFFPSLDYKDDSFPTETHAVVVESMKQLIKQAADKGIVVVITDGFRSAADQDQLYAKGRTAAGTIVTNAKGGQSFHNYGLAIDFALKNASGDVIWDRHYDGNKNGKADWDEVVELAKALGFTWGGDWPQFKDYPHLQMDFGLTIADLQNGERPDDTLTAGPNPGE